MFRWKRKNYRVVALVPGGRRAYMRALMPYLVNHETLDEIRVLENTEKTSDLEFIRGLSRFDKVNVTTLPPGVRPNGNLTVNLIYADAIDPDTLYIKIDDDIMWIEDGAIEAVLEGLVSNDTCFIATPIVINNIVCTHVLQRHGKVDFIKRYVRVEMGGFTWSEPKVAKRLHEHLLRLEKAGTTHDLHVPNQLIASTRLSINFIAFRGSDMAKLNGEIPEYFPGHQSDEEFLSAHAPAVLGKANLIVGNAVVAHHSFYPQTAHLNRTLILDRYQKLAHEKYAVPLPKLVASKSPSVLFDGVETIAPKDVTMIVSFPQQGTDFLCNHLAELPEFEYSREYFNPVVNKAEAETLAEIFGAEGDSYEGKIFHKPSEDAYSDVLGETWANAGRNLTKENYSPAAIALHAKHFFLVGLFRHRSLTVPTTYPHLSHATWNSFLKNDHDLPALRALKDHFQNQNLDSAQAEVAAHFVHWYKVFKTFEDEINGVDQDPVQVINYQDILEMNVDELTALVGAALPISDASATMLAERLAATRYGGDEAAKWVGKRRRVYQSMDVEEWYLTELLSHALRADPEFRDSPYFVLLA